MSKILSKDIVEPDNESVTVRSVSKPVTPKRKLTESENQKFVKTPGNN